MSAAPFHPRFHDLPASLPIFPLPGALLLPRGRMPLNVFEPRYLAMVEDALSGDRIIGMIQPKAGLSVEPGAVPDIYPTGCAGRIVSFAETDDGRYLVALAGLCRFNVGHELAPGRGYRRVEADFVPFERDMVGPGAWTGDGSIERPRLVNALKDYVAHFGLSVDWDNLQKTDDERLVTALAMLCPFTPEEKQALLIAADLTERARIVTALIEMSVAGGDAPLAKH
jgi:Lon protease-like protein